MDNKRLTSFLPLSLASILLCASTGLAISTSIAEAKPPSHAPAWGYRCKQNSNNCKKQRDRDNTRDDRDDDDENDDNSNYDRYTLPARTTLSSEYTGSRRITLRRNQTYPITLRIVSDIRNNQNQVLIPRNSTIEGEFRSTNRGFQFVARNLILSNGRRYQINATSGVLSYSTQNGTNSDVVVINPRTRIQISLRSDLRLS
ncbi:MAG TPA: hypothetical protein V6D15_12545 [Oculatellaceae cyanobacterium]|jgi:hypothetical protein